MGIKRFRLSPSILLVLIILSVLSVHETAAQQNDTIPDNIDSLNRRRTLPSFLLWDDFNTNPLFPNQNPFLRERSPFLPQPPADKKIEVEIDSTFQYRITDELDSGAVQPGQTYDFDDFSKIQELRLRQEYWR